MKTNIELNNIPRMTIKEFRAEVQREFKKLAHGDLMTNVVVLTDYVFSCGSIGSVLILGDDTASDNYYKSQKSIRAKEKDFGKGTCTFRDGKMYIDLQEGSARPADLEKGLKKVKIDFEVIVTKNAPKPKEEANTTKKEQITAKQKEPATVSPINNEQLGAGLDKIKNSFQKMRDIMPRALAATLTPEDLQIFGQLQQQIQQWFAIFNAASSAEQAPYKEQAIKLKEQYSKVAAIMQKNKPK